MPNPVTQTVAPPSTIPGGETDPISTILQQIGTQNQNLNAHVAATLPALTQQQVAKPATSDVPLTSSGTPITQPQAPNQAPPWQTAKPQAGGVNQRRADMGTLIGNIQGLVSNAANNLNQKRIREATNEWSRLMTAMTQPNNPQNKAIIQDILGDPKKLKQMSKALSIDYLNPAKGADNVYRQALNAAVAKHKLKEGALAKLKDMLAGGAQNDVNVNLTPAQHQQLAQQMAARFPEQAKPSAQVADQLKAALYNQILKSPEGVGKAIQNLPLQAQQLLGIGPSANAMLDAQVKSSIASAELQQRGEEFSQNLNESIANRQQQYSEFQQTQTRLDQSTQLNYNFKMKDLQQRIAVTQVAADRVRLQAQANDLTHQRLEYTNVSSQLGTVMKQLALLTNKEKMYSTEFKTQSNALPVFGTKKTGITAAGQKLIDGVEAQYKKLNNIRIGLLKKQYSLMSSLNNSPYASAAAPLASAPAASPAAASPAAPSPAAVPPTVPPPVNPFIKH